MFVVVVLFLVLSSSCLIDYFDYFVFYIYFYIYTYYTYSHYYHPVGEICSVHSRQFRLLESSANVRVTFLFGLDAAAVLPPANDSG